MRDLIVHCIFGAGRCTNVFMYSRFTGLISMAYCLGMPHVCYAWQIFGVDPLNAIA